jgi:TetR/AcrR family transcriptional repressor of mexJK operon
VDDARSPEREGRSSRKRRAILEAATAVFLRNGYVGTSMDEVAARAGVSKQTVYRHFADKEALFAEIVLSTIDQVGVPFYAGLPALGDTEDLERDLRDLARRLIRVVMQPRLLQLRRLVIAEAARFPALARSYYERGPGRTAETLAASFRELAARGLLRLDDPLVAARHFVWSVLSIPLNEVMLSGEDERFSAAELEGFADAGVHAFLWGHGPPPPAAPAPPPGGARATPPV